MCPAVPRSMAGTPRGAVPQLSRGPLGAALTEALLEADSSSLLAGWAAFFRLRGLDNAAFRRLFGGLLEESSYSSAREKRSLNLDREQAGWGQAVGTPSPPQSWAEQFRSP